MMEECKKENEEIKEAVEQLTQMSADEYERELYEIRERSRLTYNTEMYEARRKGIEEGKKQDRKEIYAQICKLQVAIDRANLNSEIEL